MREILRKAKQVVDNGRLLDFKPLLARFDELEMVLINTVRRRDEIICSLAEQISSKTAETNKSKSPERMTVFNERFDGDNCV
jgi:hypothetical protein